MKYKKLLLRNVFGKPVNTNLGEGNGVTSVSVLPASGEVGKIYYNTTDGKYYVYSNGSFTQFSADVVISAGLPQTGEAGTLYYNTLDGKYYCYDGIVFKSFVTSSIPIITAENTKNTYVYEVAGDNKTETVFTGTDEDFAAYSSTVPQGSRDTQGFYLEAGKFYDLGTIYASDDEGQKGGLRLYCVADSKTEVKEYMGRFTIDMDGQSACGLTCISSAANGMVTSDELVAVTIPDDTPDFEDGHTYEFNISASVLAIKDITYTNNP